MDEFNYEHGICIESCISCGVNFAFPISFMEEREEDHKSFYCPNGHKQYYPQQTESEKLKKRLSRTTENLVHCKLNSKTLDYRARYYKGELTKLKKTLEA